MQLCSNKHEEVCYEDSDCPVCTTRDDLQGTIDDLEKDVENLKEEIDQYENAEL